MKSIEDQINDLLNEWDPIGVVEVLDKSGLPPEEYRSYVPGILSLLKSGSDARALAEHLAFLRTAVMGLPAASVETDLSPATRLVRLFEETRMV